VLGTALLVASPSGARDPSARFLGGVLLAFVAGLAYALYVLAAKATLRRSAPLPTTALTFTIGALLLSPALFWTSAPLTQLTLGWPWLLYLGGVATAGAYAIYTVGLRGVPASVAGVTTLLEPLTATVLAWRSSVSVSAPPGAWEPCSWSSRSPATDRSRTTLVWRRASAGGEAPRA